MRRQTTGRFRIGGRRNRRASSRATAASPRRTQSFVRSVVSTVPYLVGIAAFTGGVIGVHYGWQALNGSTRLAVGAIEVTGNERVRPEEVSAYTGITVGDPILRADLDQAALLLRRHPWVRAAHVQRRLPDRIQVRVEENAPAMVVALGELYLANSEGEIFKRLSVDDRVVLPVVTGLGREELADAPELGVARIRAAIALAAAVEAEAASLGRVEELHWDADLGWSVVTRPTVAHAAGLRLHLGLEPMARLATAAAAIARLKQHNLEAEVLWADGLKNPRRVQAQLRDSMTEKDATFIAKAR